MDINTIIITAITGLVSGLFTLGVTLITTRIRARAEASQRMWTQIEWALDKALEGKTPEARQAGRRAAKAMAEHSEDPTVAAFVEAAVPAEATLITR